jgi:hypothetical protein
LGKISSEENAFITYKIPEEEKQDILYVASSI